MASKQQEAAAMKAAMVHLQAAADGVEAVALALDDLGGPAACAIEQALQGLVMEYQRLDSARFLLIRSGGAS